MVKNLIKPSLKSRLLAYEIIKLSITHDIQLSNALNSSLYKINNISNIDKRFITMIVQGTMRLCGRLDWEIKQVYNGKLDKLKLNIKIILRMGVFQLLFMDKVPNYAAIDTSVNLAKIISPNLKSLTNALLRAIISKQNKNIPTKSSSLKELSQYLSHPEWLIEKWIKDIGFNKTKDLVDWNNKAPIFWFRVNTSLYSIESFIKYLKLEKIEFIQFGELKEFFKISNHQYIIQSEIFKNGFISVQDPSAGLVVNLLDPQKGEIIIDACSAPGGKTSYISEKLNNQGEILSYDIDIKRLNKLISNLSRLKINNVKAELKDVANDKLNKTDKMLLDIPCTGTGVISKKPDIKWRKNRKQLLEMSYLQKKILWNAAKFINPGGILVYSSCSIEPEENSLIIEDFLENHPQFNLEPGNLFISKKYIDNKGFMTTTPHQHKIDGSFAARLKLND